MKANDANTLAASVGCPVGANRVEWLVAEVTRLREQVANIVKTIKDMGANVHDNPCADILTLAKTAEERLDYIKRADIWKNEDRKARAHLASLLDLPMPPGAEPPGWTTILDTVSSATFQLGEARKEIAALRTQVSTLTPRWRDGDPPEDEWVLLDGHDRPTVFRKFGGCFRYWGGSAWYVWARKIRWAPIPKPTEG